MRKFLEFFQCPNSLINKLTKPSFQDIKVAIWKQDIQKISQLLSEGAPTHQRGQSILHFATSQNKAEAVQFLVTHHPELINQRNQDGDIPLILALFSGNIKIIKCLIPQSNLNLRDYNGNTTFMIAAANGNLLVLQTIIEKCNNTMIRNFEGQSALHRAAYYGRLQTLKFLLQKTSLRFYETDKNNNNALHMACMSCRIICARYIISKVKNPNKLLEVQNLQGKKPLQLLQQAINKLNSYKKQEKMYFNKEEIFNYVLGKDQINIQ